MARTMRPAVRSPFQTAGESLPRQPRTQFRSLTGSPASNRGDSPMKRQAFVVAACVASLVAALASGQATGPIPRVADGKPDFSGMWDNPKPPGGRGGGATVFDKARMAPFKPGGEALFYEPRTGDPRRDEPRAFCMPSGFPSAFLGPYPVQIVQNPGYLVMVTEFMRVTRMIPLDGRPHQRDIEPTFYGDPVGH